MNNNAIYPTLFRQGFILFLLALLLTGCTQNIETQPNNGSSSSAAIALPTSGPTPEPSPVNTRVMPIEVLTPSPTPTITPIPDETQALVIEVIDGNTIKVVMDGDPMSRVYDIRYVGLEAPPVTDPWGMVAYEKNHELTNLKIVRLLRDETDYNAEGYLLRYVYLDKQMVNVMLVEQGLAKAAILAPNTRFQNAILAAASRAENGKLGLWSQDPPTPTVTSDRSVQASSVLSLTTGTTATTESSPTTTTTATTESIITPQSTITSTIAATATIESTVEPTAESTSESE